MIQQGYQLHQVQLLERPLWGQILTAVWVEEVFMEIVEAECMAQAACTVGLHMAAWEVECMEEGACTAVEDMVV